MLTKAKAQALIAKYSADKNANVQCLVSEARAMFRAEQFAKVVTHLSPEMVQRQRNLW